MALTIEVDKSGVRGFIVFNDESNEAVGSAKTMEQAQKIIDLIELAAK